MRFARCLGLTCLLVATGGCASRPTGPGSGTGLDVLGPVTASAPLVPDDVYPLVPGEWRYRVIGEDDDTGAVVYRREEAGLLGVTWMWSEGDVRTEFWRVDDDGNLVMPVVHEPADNAIVRFEPALVVAFSSLAPGEARTQKVAMRVVSDRDESKERERGTATRVTEYVGDVRLRTPLGDLPVKRVSVHFIADLRFAYADKRTTLYVAPGLGIVAEERDEQVSILGIPSRSSRRTIVLTDHPAGLTPSRPGE